MEGLQDGRITLAWNIAAFERQKKLKDVKTYFGKEKMQPPKDLKAKMDSLFMAHNMKKDK